MSTLTVHRVLALNRTRPTFLSYSRKELHHEPMPRDSLSRPSHLPAVCAWLRWQALKKYFQRRMLNVTSTPGSI